MIIKDLKSRLKQVEFFNFESSLANFAIPSLPIPISLKFLRIHLLFIFLIEKIKLRINCKMEIFTLNLDSK